MVIWGNTLNELFMKVGFTRWPLLLCSIIGLAIICERSAYYYRLRFNYSQFRRDLFILLRNNQLMKAIHFCQNKLNPVPYIAGVYLQNLHNKCRDGILSREASLSLERVEDRLSWLSTITHVSPLLGLLGTVTGLVAAFHEIELASGQVQAQSLASGIWEALLSTVFGLIIAIPCMVAYHGFETEADRISRRMHATVLKLDEFYGNNVPRGFTKTQDAEISDSAKNVME
jgi:biopolymer transport protein ExbB